ncbi:hypothetical protein CDD83_1838 [Cordyceps sp. RAO-2017]|nr:hypothetical protein CDD83_1838 [Cordyceps sp. RAO-2017]
MHQQARPPPRLSSPASTPQPSQTRSGNNPRDAVLGARQRAESNASLRDAMGSPTVDNALSLGPPAESVKKLDQIVQNFYAKAAILVLDARIKVKITRNANGLRKTNKWYQIETDEVDDFRDELKVWKTCGSLDNRPPPMIIEVYLDTSRLKENQSLVILDDEGRRWDVMEQLNASRSSTGSNSPGVPTKNAELVLERWRVELKTTLANEGPSDDFGPILPAIYKKAIVFFRTLFVTTRLLPAWKFASHSAAKSSHPALIPRCRVLTSDPAPSSPDPLRQPIDGRRDAVTEYMFGDLDVPVGRLGASVVYRNDCSFRIDDAESLLSSHFMGVDENFFRPSLPQYGDRQRAPAVEPGSLRSHRWSAGIGDVQQTYGSLSTFHGDGPLGTSPISALRAVKPPGSDTSSPPASFPAHAGLDCPSSLPVPGRPSSSRAPARPPSDGSARRTSISFQPFKAGSLSGSPVPRTLDSESPARGAAPP